MLQLLYCLQHAIEYMHYYGECQRHTSELGSKLSFLRFSISLSFLKLHYQSAKFLQGKFGASKWAKLLEMYMMLYMMLYMMEIMMEMFINFLGHQKHRSPKVRPHGASPKQIEDLRADRISATSPHLCKLKFCKFLQGQRQFQGMTDNVTWICLKTMGKLPKSNGSLSFIILIKWRL